MAKPKPKSTPKPTRSKAPAKAKASKGRGRDKVVLLSGGNLQIAKGYGDAPVQAYLAALPGWKREVGRRIDALAFKALVKAAVASNAAKQR